MPICTNINGNPGRVKEHSPGAAFLSKIKVLNRWLTMLIGPWRMIKAMIIIIWIVENKVDNPNYKTDC